MGWLLEGVVEREVEIDVFVEDVLGFIVLCLEFFFVGEVGCGGG